MAATRPGPGLQNPHLRRLSEERAAAFQNRVADGITSFAGSMWFVYIHIVVFAVWVVTDGGPFGDPFPFGLLTMVVSLEAIFLSTFILISQNRADARRAALADHEWLMVQAEEGQNEQLLALSRQLLALTTQVHQLTTEVHAAVAPRTPTLPDEMLDGHVFEVSANATGR